MSAAPKDPKHQGPIELREVNRSGEHIIGLDAMIRSSFESAFESDLQATSRVSRFELEEVLSSPDVRPSTPPETPEATVKTTVEAARAAMAAMVEAEPPSEPIVPTPIVNVVSPDYAEISVGSLPPPAVEVDRTKEEERDP